MSYVSTKSKLLNINVMVLNIVCAQKDGIT